LLFGNRAGIESTEICQKNLILSFEAQYPAKDGMHEKYNPSALAFHFDEWAPH